jgi:predicted PhzF superfamily epimerase YddE/YHI9
VAEDPVTGSLNAGIAMWLIKTGQAPSSYVVSQGTALKRRGRVFVDRLGEEIWIGGDTRIRISGTVDFSR